MNTLSKWGINLGLTLGLAWSYSVFAAQKLDSIVAIVNDGIVLQSDLTIRLLIVQRQLSNDNTKLPDLNVLTNQVLNQLIIENLQLQLATKKGVHIADPTVDIAIERIAKNNKISADKLEQAIADNGETMVQFRTRIRQELTIKEIQVTSVNQRIRISEHEVDRYLASNQGQQLVDTEYEIGHILISLSAQPDAQELEAAQQTLNAINSAIEKVASLAALLQPTLMP